MLSDDDHDSLFGDDSQGDHEQAGLALPSLHGKTMAAAAANGECGGSRVGTSALSVSPLPVSEQSSPAALSSSGSAPLPAQSVVPGRNVPTGRTPPSSSQSHQSKNKRVAISVPEPAADGPRPNNFLRSQTNLLGVAGSVSSNLGDRRVHLPPTGASADDAIPILDDDAEPQRPKKRRRKAAHPSPSLNSSPADAIRAVMQSLTTDLSVTSLLQALLEHLKSFSDPTTTKIRRVDINGREISEEEWRFLKTQDLVRKLSAALKKALKAAGGGGSNSSTVEMLQTVIQQWIQSKLVSQVTNSPSITPVPSTPSPLASVAPLSTLSAHSTLSSNTSDCGVGLDLTWKKTGLTSWGPRQAIPAEPTFNSGTLITPDPSLGGSSGQFDFGELESLLGLIPTLEPSPSISFRSDMASPTLDMAIDPSLPPWPDLPALAASQQWISEASAASTSYLPHSASMPPVGEITGNQDSVMLPVADVPSNPEPPSSHLFDPSLPLGFTPPGSLSSIPPSAMTPQQTDRQADDSYPAAPPYSAPQPVPPSGGQNQPTNRGKTTKMAATLERARAHRRSLQAAMDKALTTMWELEIEHATLSKVLKGITDRQALSSVAPQE
ncbi:hypothetical protein FRC04_000349 [Tulasnella sp. 424]|nr:hypothetical protein FRC04_000349 [Tulasnella sp. 424]KAG8973307.1 hypothetical protein FRC05_008851 [Tulasnella sp. 425]